MASNSLPPDDGGQMLPDSMPAATAPDVVISDASNIDIPSLSAEYDQIASQLDTAVADAQSALAEVGDSVEGDLLAGESQYTSAVADISGGVDNALTAADNTVQAIVGKVAAGIDTAIDGAVDSLIDTGIDYPTNVPLQGQMLGTPASQWIDTVIPGALTAEDTSATDIYTDPLTGQPIPSGGQLLTGIDTSPPPPPPYSPPYSPPTSPPTTVSGGGDMLSCPAPVVNCPAPAAIPPFPPFPTCPTPIVNVTVNTGDQTITGTFGEYQPNPQDTGTTTGTPIPPAPTTPPVVPGTPPPPPPPPPPPTAGKPKWPTLPEVSARAECIEWDVQEICDVAQLQSKGGTGYAGGLEVDAPGGGAGGGNTYQNTWLSAAAGTLSIAIPGFSFIPFNSDAPASLSGVLNTAVEHTVASELLPKLMEGLTGTCVENKSRVNSLIVQLAACGYVESILHAPTMYLAQSLIYQYQSLNPQFLPQQADWDAMYLRAYIDDATWECGTKANGNLPGWHRVARATKTQLLTPDQIVQLWRRGLLPGDDVNKRLRETGVENAGYQRDMQTLSELPLGASDIIRCMVRDSFDEGVVTEYDYDKDFDTKFSGRAEEWFKWQGYSAEQARYIWRAHWNIPSNTQLYEMLHRLRPDRAEILAHNAQFPPNPDGSNPQGAPDRPTSVTAADVQEALEVNDQAPAWIKSLMAISYHPWTNSDAIRAYMLGYLDKDELAEHFQDNGYNANDSGELADYWEYEAKKRIRTQAGVLTPRKVIGYYTSGAMSRDQARQALQDLFPNQGYLDQILADTDKQIDADVIQQSAKALRSQYLHYAIDDLQLSAALRNVGVDAGAIARTVQLWKAERDGRSKEVTAMTLCKWSDRGLILPDEYYQRLVMLGYTPKDAQRIASVCQIDSATKRAKAAKAAAKEAAADAKAALMQQLTKLQQEVKDAQTELDALNAAIAARGG